MTDTVLTFRYQDTNVLSTKPGDTIVPCITDQTMLDVVEQFAIRYPEFIRLEFYMSMYSQNWQDMLVSEYQEKTKGSIFKYTPVVEVKFRFLDHDSFDWWCLEHGPCTDRLYEPTLKVFDLCTRFAGQKYANHEVLFYDANGDSILERFDRDTTIEMYFVDNGPIIFYDYRPLCPFVSNMKFHVRTYIDRHFGPKEITIGPNVSAGSLNLYATSSFSFNPVPYKHDHSSLLELKDGNITRIVNPEQKIADLQFQENVEYFLGDMFHNHNQDEDHYDVSVQFENGGDMLRTAVLVCVKNGETIYQFSKNLMAKILKKDVKSPEVVFNAKKLKVNVGGTAEYGGSSRKKLQHPNPDNMRGIPVYKVNVEDLPNELLYCEYEYEFKFYDRCLPRNRIKDEHVCVGGLARDKLSDVIAKFVNLPDKYDFFNSRGSPIEEDDMNRLVNHFARHNDLVILFQLR